MFLVQSVIDIIVSNKMLLMSILLVPRVFLWIVFVLLLVTFLLIIDIFLVSFNLKNCNCFIAPSLTDFSINHKVVAFTQIFNKAGELFVGTNVIFILVLFFLENIQKRAVWCLNRNQEALIILDQ